jgi:hypothetical protein
LRLIVLARPAVLRYTKPRSSSGTPSDTGTPRQKFPWQKTTRQPPEKPTIQRPTRHYILPVQRRKSHGWPTFTFFVKVRTHAADAGGFILASPH